jgi:hypothetical protein
VCTRQQGGALVGGLHTVRSKPTGRVKCEGCARQPETGRGSPREYVTSEMEEAALGGGDPVTAAAPVVGGGDCEVLHH